AGTGYRIRVVSSNPAVTGQSANATVTVNPAVEITLGANPSMIQGSATTLNLPYTANNGVQSNVTFDGAATSAGITGFQSTSISGASGNIVLQLPYCLKAGTYSGTLNVNTYTPNNCTSVNYPFSIIIISFPAPTGTEAQSFCSGARVANLVPNIGGASSIKWYDAAIGGNLFTSNTVLTSGTHYYASQTSAGCESTARLDVTATITPAASIASATGTSPLCVGGTATYLANTVVLGGGIGAWSSSNTAVATVSTSGLVTGVAAGTADIIYTITGGCGSANATGKIIINSVGAAPTIGAITQPTCATGTGSLILNGLPPQWALTQYPGGTITTGTGTSTTIPGLSSGTYNYSVIGTNNGTGLKGEYFNNRDLFGSPALTRTDATVAFDWGNGSPGAPITNDNFSVRWTGQIQPLYSENYTFTTRSDDGIRLWINGTQIINNWTTHSVTTDNSSLISLIAGVKYDIILEYYEAGGQAVSQLSWRSASQAQQIIPQSQLYSVIASCSSPASANVVIDAQPTTPAAPAPGTVTQPDCITPTGSVVLSKLPSGNWTINPGGLTGSGSSITINGLTEGTYNFTVSTANLCTSLPSSITIVGLETKTWNGSAWSGLITGTDVPTLEKNIDFTGTYNLNIDIEGCSCKIGPGVAVTVQSGKHMKIVNAVSVLGTGTTAG
ncbi:MAG: PA14 domain-containing protein, partial [Nonlabens sp.]|uniref:PA14 domain-containing protein n=1 Tax=Nonlabens sp. TaxID=1888209 RepID=UPI0035A63398